MFVVPCGDGFGDVLECLELSGGVSFAPGVIGNDFTPAGEVGIEFL